MGLRLRQAGVVLVSVWASALVARVLLHDLIGLEGWAVSAPQIAAAVLGLAVGLAEARRVRPMLPREQRNAVIGWGIVVSIIPVGACLYIEMPWGALAAVGTAAGCALMVRVAAGVPG